MSEQFEQRKNGGSNSKLGLYRLAVTAVFAALVFVSSMISIPIPVAIGDVTRIHLGNIFCLLSGFILGPVGGGLAAGIGSALYDLTNPAYIASAPFTFVFKFGLACICGLISHAKGHKGEKFSLNVAAAIAGSVTYMVLYLGKGFGEGLLMGNAVEALIPALLTKLGTSSINAAIAVVVSLPLCAAVRVALKKSGLLAKVQKPKPAS